MPSTTPLAHRPPPAPPASAPEAWPILLIGWPEGSAREIGDAWRERAGAPARELRVAATLAAALPELRKPWLCSPAAIVFGPLAPGGEVAAWLSSRPPGDPAVAGRLIVLGAGADASPFAGLVDEDRIFYLAARPPAAAEVAELLAAACETSADAAAAAAEEDDEPPAEVLRQVLEIERSRGLDAALDGLEQAAQKLVPARRAWCRFIDAETLTLWRPGAGAAAEVRDSAVSGLVGFVARTGRSVAVARVGEDPRYDAEVDGGGRSRRAPFLAVALPAGPGAREPGAAEAVLALSRGEGQKPFGGEELRRLEAFARELGPILRRRRIAFEQARRESENEIFRREALAHRETGARLRQEPLRLAPAWVGAAYRAVLLLFLLGLLAIPFAGGWLPGLSR